LAGYPAFSVSGIRPDNRQVKSGIRPDYPVHPNIKCFYYKDSQPCLLVSAIGVDATAMNAGIVPGVVALVHVDVAVGPVEPGPAGAAVAVAKRGAGGTIATRLTRAIVRLLTVLP
jgi:hypothetical protein